MTQHTPDTPADEAAIAAETAGADNPLPRLTIISPLLRDQINTALAALPRPALMRVHCAGETRAFTPGTHYFTAVRDDPLNRVDYLAADGTFLAAQQFRPIRADDTLRLAISPDGPFWTLVM